MEDSRVWEFEKSLWTGDADHYRASIDDDCLMVRLLSRSFWTARRRWRRFPARPAGPMFR